jgi:hypothetical protein
VVKKKNQETVLFDTKNNATNISDKNHTTSKNKTTNVNILLNRVRLDEKKIFRKKLIFTFVLITAISSFGIFIII